MVLQLNVKLMYAIYNYCLVALLNILSMKKFSEKAYTTDVLRCFFLFCFVF